MAEQQKNIYVTPFFNKELYTEVVENLILNTKTTLWIVTANLKNIFVKNPNNSRELVSVFEIFNYLIKRNVNIQILHSATPSKSFNNYIEKYTYLFDKGLDLRRCQRVHMKIIISDDKKAYVGSANFTGAGIGIKGINKRNFELGFITKDSTYIKELEYLVSSIWYGEECKNCLLRKKCEVPITELKY